MPVAKAKKKAPAGRVPAFGMKSTQEYKDWLDALSAETMIPLTAIFKDAVEAWAAERGLPAPPEGERVRKAGRKGGA